MIEFLTGTTRFLLFAILGTGIVVSSTLITAFAYRGKQGERFSPLNHFISELGEVGVSRLAWVFNLSLILTGACLTPACISLGLMLPGTLAKIGMAAGIICSIGLSFVGVFPMNNLKPHGMAAMIYFRAGLLMVILFSLAIAIQPASSSVLPRAWGLAGLPAVLAFSGFLVAIHITSKDVEDPLSLEEVERPKVWLLPVLEWSIFITLILWFCLIAVGI